MRVIGGSAKGQRLHSLPGESTRPTLDRIKESIFNMIQLYVLDAKVLDLFAGSGALGIEALSRGAAECCFVDGQRDSIQVISDNLAKTKLTAGSSVLSMDYQRALTTFKGQGKTFDLIFLDPPYKKGLAGEALRLIEKEDLLSPRGLIIVEQDHRETLTTSEEQYLLWKEKKYGNTIIRILKKNPESSPGGGSVEKRNLSR